MTKRSTWDSFQRSGKLTFLFPILSENSDMLVEIFVPYEKTGTNFIMEMETKELSTYNLVCGYYFVLKLWWKPHVVPFLIAGDMLSRNSTTKKYEICLTVSSLNSITENITQVIDYWLQPIVKEVYIM